MKLSVVTFCLQKIVIEFPLMLGIFDPLSLEINIQLHIFGCACCYFVKFDKTIFCQIICQWPTTVTNWRPDQWKEIPIILNLYEVDEVISKQTTIRHQPNSYLTHSHVLLLVFVENSKDLKCFLLVLMSISSNAAIHSLHIWTINYVYPTSCRD